MKARGLGATKAALYALLAGYLLSGPAAEAAAAAAGAGTPSLPHGWTLEEMKKAVPYPMEKMPIPYRGAQDPFPQAVLPQAVGTPGWVPSRPPDGWTRPLIVDNPAGTYPPPAPTLDNVTDYVPFEDVVKFPHIATGKIYFVRQGRNYVCSGFAIGENAVWTAGHCIADETGVFHDNWIFIPGFDMYRSAYTGRVPVYEVLTSEFALNTDLSFDYGIVIVRPIITSTTQSLRQEVGAMGFAWNMPREQQWMQLGYPQLIFDGVRLVFSNGTYYRDNPRFHPASIGVGSRMKSGCSGGPWLLNPMIGEAGEANYFNGSNSYISSVADELYSPYLDDRAKRLWDCAQNSTLDKLVCADGKAAADLVLTNTAGSGPVPPGSPFTYTLRLENLGPAEATNIVLTNRLPAAASPASVDLPGGACSVAIVGNGATHAITCTLESLPSGASAVATVVVTAPPTRGAFSNLATVVFDQIGEWTAAAGAYTYVCDGDRITVTNADDSGPGSLREAMDRICAEGTIDFAPALSGAVIHLVSQLEPTQAVIIDGSALPQRITLSGDTDGDGVGDTRVMAVRNSVTLRGLNITKGRSAEAGGGIFNEGWLKLIDCTVVDNSSGEAGGGIFNAVGQTLIVIDSTLSGNTARNGGGIFVEGGTEEVCRICTEGTARVEGSTLSGNSARRNGGGIENRASLAVSNSTLSRNSAINRSGGGIANSGTLTLLNSTLSANSGAEDLGGGLANSGTLHFANTIIANSRSGDCFNSGTIATNSHNLVEDGSCRKGGVHFKEGDPGLGPLADNGGPTRTLALLPGSVAIDSGDDVVCSAEPVRGSSQNGASRPQRTHCDRGSYEAGRTRVLRSTGANDGWVLESAEGSSVGQKSSPEGALRVGDDSLNREYRSILHFDAALPEGAVITGAALEVRRKDLRGGALRWRGRLIADLRHGFFGSSELEGSDFESLAPAEQKDDAGRFVVNSAGWYRLTLDAVDCRYLNPTGATQFRLRFALPVDHDNHDDCARFFAGEADPADRPRLTIQYYENAGGVAP